MPPQPMKNYKSQSCFWGLYPKIFGTIVEKNVKIAQTEILSTKFRDKS